MVAVCLRARRARLFVVVGAWLLLLALIREGRGDRPYGLSPMLVH
jgi:hypothetical protein